jgi:Pentapeptide repeats (8 copies)
VPRAVKGAIFNGANLGDASLANSNLDRAYFREANLAHVTFEPNLTSMPDIQGFADAQNLNLMQFRHSPTALVIVRKQFKEAGLREQENKITCAIRRSEMLRRGSDGALRHGAFERVFNCVLFEWTCQYGMLPGLPLLIALEIALFMGIFYVFAQMIPWRFAGIWVVWDDKRILQNDTRSKVEKLRNGFPLGRRGMRTFWPCPFSTLCSIVGLALYFSLISATQIGWRDLSVGTSISRILPREYSLRGTGWVRALSGFQSLISVYLVALSVLTYFGTPFE